MPRRLLTVMLLLLVGLVVASLVAPPPDRRNDTSRTPSAPKTTPAATPTATATAPRRTSGSPSAVRAVLPRDRRVSARPGQSIDLRVTSGASGTIEIPALGAVQPVSPTTPAQFIVAFDQAGRYDVRNLDTGDSVGTVVVGE